MMLSTFAYAALAATAALAGFVDSVAGGGGLITVPALLYAGLPPALMLGTNKAQSVCGTALAAFRYHRAGLFRLRPNLPLAGFVLAGAAAGAWTIQHIDAGVLRLLIPLLLIAVALYTLLSPRMHDHDGDAALGPRGYWPVGSGIGFYDGFFGPGTGQFFAITLVSLRGLGLTRATGLTKLLNLTSNLASVVVFALGGRIAWGLAAAMACGAMGGAWLGSHFATRHGAQVIRPMLIVASLALTANLVRQWFAG
ncbi:MAG: TSUP family transporter [Sphingomonadales bacterium]|nr:TSUP family transporter [Sphingomonadales bacterium]